MASVGGSAAKQGPHRVVAGSVLVAGADAGAGAWAVLAGGVQLR